MEWDQNDPIKIELYALYKEMFLVSLEIKKPEAQQNLEENKNYETNKLLALGEEEKKLNSNEDDRTKNTKLSEKPDFNQDCETKNTKFVDESTNFPKSKISQRNKKGKTKNTKFVDESTNFPKSKISQRNKNQQNAGFFDDCVMKFYRQNKKYTIC